MALKKPTHMPESVAPQNGGRSLSCKPANTSGQKRYAKQIGTSYIMARSSKAINQIKRTSKIKKIYGQGSVIFRASYQSSRASSVIIRRSVVKASHRCLTSREPPLGCLYIIIETGVSLSSIGFIALFKSPTCFIGLTVFIAHQRITLGHRAPPKHAQGFLPPYEKGPNNGSMKLYLYYIATGDSKN